MTPREVVELLLDVGAVEIRTDPDQWFTWASGKRAPIYCDHRILCSFPAERSRIAAALAASIRERHPAVEVIAGTATAGIPHAAWVADLLDLPMVYVRGAAKGHGQQKRVEGRPLQGESVVIVEDLVSYGGSSLSSVEAVNGEGGKVLGVQAIFTYGFPQTVARFEEAGVPCHALGDYATLLSMLRLDEASARALRDWQAQ